MADVSSLIGRAQRIQKPNSTPRTIAIFGLGPRGKRLVQRALDEGIDVASFELSDLPLVAGDRIRRDRLPDLAVVVAHPEEAPPQGTHEIYAWARDLGVLLTAVVLIDEHSVFGPRSVDVLRRHSDLIIHTSDEDFLPIMLQSLGRAC